jgi:hypothetical protein
MTAARMTAAQMTATTTAAELFLAPRAAGPGERE